MPALAAVTIDVSTVPDAYLGVEYTYSIPVSGLEYNHRCTVVAGTWPLGLTISSLCQLSGIPTVSGAFSFQLKVLDPNDAVLASGVLTIRVLGDLVLRYPPTSGRVGQALSASPSVTGATPPLTFSVLSGALPPGVNLNSSTGVLSGTPISGGDYSPHIGVTDSRGLIGRGIATFQLLRLVLEIIPSLAQQPHLPDVKVGYPWSFQFGANGGVPPYRFETNGVTPGMTLSSSGLLSGMVLEEGPGIGVSIQALDAHDNRSGFLSYSARIVPGTSISPQGTNLPEGQEGTSYSQAFTASGMGSGITVAAVGSLPPGLTLSMTGPNTAELRGTATLAGLYPFTVRFHRFRWRAHDEVLFPADSRGCRRPAGDHNFLASIRACWDPLFGTARRRRRQAALFIQRNTPRGTRAE